MEEIYEKLEKLKKYIKDLGKVAVAYSGGVDSTFLLKVSKEVLDNNVIAITLVSPLYPRSEIEFAKNMAKELGVRHIIIQEENIFKNEEFIKNPPDRCYLCKKMEFREIIEYAKKEGIEYVLDGSNADDLKDYRPGRRALLELNVKSPLLELGFTKEEIRRLSLEYGLPTYNKPSFACLASRIPYGETITMEELKRIDEGEEFLRGLGFKQVRLRSHGGIARIEVDSDSFNIIMERREEILEKLKKLGYIYVTLDLEGYKMGSMNKILKEKSYG